MQLRKSVCLFVGILLCATLSLTVGARESASKKDDQYAHATRKDPRNDMTEREQRDLNKAVDLINDDKGTEALPLLEKVIDNGRASKTGKSTAYHLKGQVEWQEDKYPEAIADIRKALETDGLSNAQHYGAMYQVAQLQLNEEKYADALATLERWLAESGAQTPDSYALRANIEYRLDKFPEAVASMEKAIAANGGQRKPEWTQILMASYMEQDKYDEAARMIQQDLAKDPDNKQLRNQLANIYIQAEQPEKAQALLAQAKSSGQVNTEDDYLQLAKLYAAGDKPKDAAATLKEGFAKGIIKPSYDSYKLLGDVCNQAEDDACAIDAYTKASPMAKDGNADYQLGYLLFYTDRSKEAKAAFDRAIAKGGLHQEGEAYLLRGDAENDYGNAAAAMADWKKAAGYPTTKSMAEQRIRIAGSGGRMKRAGKKQ
jgi:predicted Zn-dependent protease